MFIGALFYVIVNKVNLILAFTTLYEFFKLFCLYYTLTHIEYNIFELSLDEYYFQAHAHDLVQSEMEGFHLLLKNGVVKDFPIWYLVTLFPLEVQRHVLLFRKPLININLKPDW